jgi:hypothetical protein
MSAVEEYTDWKATVFAFRQPSAKLFQTFSKADAAIESLKSERDKWKGRALDAGCEADLKLWSDVDGEVHGCRIST